MKIAKSIKILILIMGLLMQYACTKKEKSPEHKDQHGNHEHGGEHWMAPEKEAKKVNPMKATKVSLKTGQKIYQEKCSACHGVKGDGKGSASKGLNPPPANYTDNNMMSMHSDGDLFWKIGEGKGVMPSYKKTLNDNDKWNLVNYIRTFSKGSSTSKEHDKHNHEHK